eukprot:Nitzschia sp. Nitz4//scaffold80_size88189//44728//50076//NITZ4_005089-RA/size88189-processed-gene-0.31-mRNA-1//-1//CDS//3329558636//929//frame0
MQQGETPTTTPVMAKSLTEMKKPVALSLLEGIAKSGNASAIVSQVFRQWNAGQRLAGLLIKLWRSHQSSSNKSGNTSSAVQPPSKRRPMRRWGQAATTQEHWLLTSLQSPSNEERRVALQILCRGCPADAHSLWQLVELLVALISRCLHPRSLSTRHAPPDSCPLALLALLKHILLLPDLQFSLAFFFHHRIGLRWISYTLWEQVNPTNNPSVPSEAVMVALVDLLDSLLVQVNHAQQVDTNHRDAAFWHMEYLYQKKLNASSNISSWTPLACLLAVYHVVKQQRYQQGSVEKNMLTRLKHILDPYAGTEKEWDSLLSTSFKAVSSESTKTLMDTFQSSTQKQDDASNGDSKPTSPAVRRPANQAGSPLHPSLMELSSFAQSLFPSRRNADVDADADEEEEAGGEDAEEMDEDGDRPHLWSEMEEFSVDENNREDDENENENDDEDMIEVDEPSQETTSSSPKRKPLDLDMEDNGSMDEEEEDDKNKEDKKHSSEDQEKDDDDDEEIESDEECDSDEDDDDDGDIIIRGTDDNGADDDEISYIQDSLLDLQQLEEDVARGGSQGSRGAGAPSSPHAEMPVNAKWAPQRKEYSYLFRKNKIARRVDVLPLAAECELLSGALNIVKPPKKPFNAKIIIRRAPTQEEFFRGSLSKNPISFHSLRREGNSSNEPTVRDLRQHIADDLQMSDSAELLELLVANKILDVDLKLRVVNQVVWKNHLIQNSQGSSSGMSSGSVLSSLLGGSRSGGRSIVSASGLGIFFGRSSLGDSGGRGESGRGITEDTPVSALPSMIVTYRLTGVDGEATEDSVSTLDDPEAPSTSTDPDEIAKRMEKEFGLTRLLTDGRGLFYLLKSVERNIADTLRTIRRDDVGGGDNDSREHFKKSSPYAGITLLECCAKLPDNRKLLLTSRAPTILLRLLLDVLHGLEDHGLSESNATAKALQELIEILASDMVSSTGNKGPIPDVEEEDFDQDSSTLRLLLGAIESSALSRSLRNVIAKLLPYLTYGQASLSKELASEFLRHVKMEELQDFGQGENYDDKAKALMATFVHASINMPVNDVCNSLRDELKNCHYVERIARFVLIDAPLQPSPWTPALWAQSQEIADDIQKSLQKQWKHFLERPGLKIALNMLIGLCKGHASTQVLLGSAAVNGDQKLSLLELCHWIESTSDSTTLRIEMDGLGLIAETFLDEVAEGPIASSVKDLRKKTKDRKKEIAMSRRKKALVNMNAFKSINSFPTLKTQDDKKRSCPESSNDCDNLASSKRQKKDTPKENVAASSTKPSWMEEMECLEDETGLTCAVCHEGRQLQPAELLGLYAYVKKVTIPSSQCNGRSSIDGSVLLVNLPQKVPTSLEGSYAALEWLAPGRAVGLELKESPAISLSSLEVGRRPAHFITSVSAANAIHCSCHEKARQADRNHPKAPKSEWEGATLRNSRVKCNVIIPLVSSRSSKVPLVAVDTALTEHQSAISNLLGARPKSMLWTILHDIRFLLLRMAYGEPLNSDCGGGSLASNCRLLFHQLLMLDVFESDAQLDCPEIAQHARFLSAGFLGACAIMAADDNSQSDRSRLQRGIADSAVMACLTAVVFHNGKVDKSDALGGDTPEKKSRWHVGKEYFLRGLLNCAGLRHAMSVTSSGCITGRSGGTKSNRLPGFVDWVPVESVERMENNSERSSDSVSPPLSLDETGGSKANIEDFRNVIRPMITMYAIMDQLSRDFVQGMDDTKVEECADRLVLAVEACHHSKNLEELLHRSKVTLDDGEMIDELQRGMIAA